MAQCQWRTDDSDKWKYKFGNGSDGNLTISSNTTYSPIDASCNGSSGAYTLTATNNNFSSDQLVLIHQSQGTSAGHWELNKIASYASGTITLEHPLCYNYRTNSSNADKAQVLVLKQYQTVIIDSGVSLNAKAWNGSTGGIIAFCCKDALKINGTISLENGYRETTPWYYNNYNNYGEGTNGASSHNNTKNANGNGGGAGLDSVEGEATGGGGGGNGTTGGTVGNTNVGGSSSSDSNLVIATFGGAGGAGGAINSASIGGWQVGGKGGKGGALSIILAKDIQISGRVIANGEAGGNVTKLSDYKHAGAGGGGAGGSILFKATTAQLGNNIVTATGGTGGKETGASSGGAGGSGVIRLEYAKSYTGSTIPTLSVTKNTHLVDGGNNCETLLWFLS